jgi:hypothetical protein
MVHVRLGNEREKGETATQILPRDWDRMRTRRLTRGINSKVTEGSKKVVKETGMKV